MTVVRKFYPEVRLKRLVAEPGGRRMGDAIKSAQDRVEEIRVPTIEGVEQKTVEIDRLAKSGESGWSDACYTLANEIFAEAGVFDLHGLSKAAYMLCAYISSVAPEEVRADAVIVHADAMRALRTKVIADNPVASKAILAGLDDIAAKLKHKG